MVNTALVFFGGMPDAFPRAGVSVRVPSSGTRREEAVGLFLATTGDAASGERARAKVPRLGDGGYIAGGYDIATHALPGLLRGKFDTDSGQKTAQGR